MERVCHAKFYSPVTFLLGCRGVPKQESIYSIDVLTVVTVPRLIEHYCTNIIDLFADDNFVESLKEHLNNEIVDNQTTLKSLMSLHFLHEPNIRLTILGCFDLRFFLPSSLSSFSTLVLLKVLPTIRQTIIINNITI
jgi:hypothetical protein